MLASRTLAEAVYAEWVNNPAKCSPGPASGVSLAEHLDANPSSADALGAVVIPRYMRDQSTSPSFPYTYAEPFGPGSGFEYSPAPNANQWHDNPFFDPTLDTDGDGYTDAEETIAGTDPMDDESVPTVSPWPDPGPGEDPWPDADGDGIPDQFDPCPFHVYNSCAAVEPSEIEFPEDYAREDTLGQVVIGVGQVESAVGEVEAETARGADTLERIETLLETDDNSTPELVPFVAPEAEVEGLAEWLPDFSAVEAAWTTTLQTMETDIGDLAASAATKFPFAFGSMLGSVPSFSNSECLTFPVSFMDEVGAVDLCTNNPLDGVLSTTGRSILAAVALLAFIWTSVQLVIRT
jgi:hypothetical protein